MYVLDVYIQHARHPLNRPFTYVYDGPKKVSMGMRVNVNFNNQDLVGYIKKVVETDKTKDEIEHELGFKVKDVEKFIDEEPILDEKLQTLGMQVASYYFAPLISVLRTMLPPSLRPQKSYIYKPKVKTRRILVPLTKDTEGLTKRQSEVLLHLNDQGYALKSDVGPTIVKKLLELNKVREDDLEVYRYKQVEEDRHEEFTLTKDQQDAINAFNNSSELVFLLQGVTGSGKTEIYYHLAKQTIEQGRQVLFLIPEIILTDQMIRYFKKRFNFNIAILHSGLTDAEKYDEYRRIIKERVDVVIGARSAIFAPLVDVGLIIVDEEQSDTYKNDAVPFYDARTVAIMRAKLENARVIYGTATPTIETKYKAETGAFAQFILPHRINNQDLPDTDIVDISNKNNISDESPFISIQLLNALKETMEKGEQALLLVNRRGYAAFTVCKNCGYLYRCPKCNTVLTYHKEINKLECHHCGYTSGRQIRCPKCNSRNYQHIGFGTEKIVEDVKKIFPEKLVVRLDTNEVSSSEEGQKIVSLFADGVGDIMIGTQMISKGHDFPNVTLVAVVNPDVSLALPYYRSSETLFSLITQTVGRGGRAEKRGHAIIQTTNVNNPLIQLSAAQNYQAFYELELQNRRLLGLPPFTKLISISVFSNSIKATMEAIDVIKKIFYTKFKDEVTIIGPSNERWGISFKKYGKRLILKHNNYFKIKMTIVDIMKRINKISKYDLVINVDPLDI